MAHPQDQDAAQRCSCNAQAEPENVVGQQERKFRENIRATRKSGGVSFDDLR